MHICPLTYGRMPVSHFLIQTQGYGKCGQYVYLSPEDLHTQTQTFSLKVKLHKLRFLRIDDVLLIVVAS